jgi:peptide/nickel transport system ATP-binding protein
MPLRYDRSLSKFEANFRVDETFDEAELSRSFQAYFPHELSGGQRQRIGIARAIVRRPSFIVVDEPILALDMTIQKQVLELFQTLRSKIGFTCLFITHDIAAVEQIADRIVVMKDGSIVKQDLRDDILDIPKSEYTKKLLDAASTVRM